MHDRNVIDTNRKSYMHCLLAPFLINVTVSNSSDLEIVAYYYLDYIVNS